MKGNFAGDDSLAFNCLCFSTGGMTLGQTQKDYRGSNRILHRLRAAGGAPHHWQFSKARGTGGYRSEDRVCKKDIPPISSQQCW